MYISMLDSAAADDDDNHAFGRRKTYSAHEKVERERDHMELLSGLVQSLLGFCSLCNFWETTQHWRQPKSACTFHDAVVVLFCCMFFVFRVVTAEKITYSTRNSNGLSGDVTFWVNFLAWETKLRWFSAVNWSEQYRTWKENRRRRIAVLFELELAAWRKRDEDEQILMKNNKQRAKQWFVLTSNSGINANPRLPLFDPRETLEAAAKTNGKLCIVNFHRKWTSVLSSGF
jgi:hypothetical protein